MVLPLLVEDDPQAFERGTGAGRREARSRRRPTGPQQQVVGCVVDKPADLAEPFLARPHEFLERRICPIVDAEITFVPEKSCWQPSRIERLPKVENRAPEPRVGHEE